MQLIHVVSTLALVGASKGLTAELLPYPTYVPNADPATEHFGAHIVSYSGGNVCLDLPGGDTTNGALLWLWECDDSTDLSWFGNTQQWSFENGRLVYRGDTTKCVDLLGGDTTNGNRLGLWDCIDGQESQQWGWDQDPWNKKYCKEDFIPCDTPEGGHRYGSIYLGSSAQDATKCIQIADFVRPTFKDLEGLQGYALEIWDCAAPESLEHGHNFAANRESQLWEPAHGVDTAYTLLRPELHHPSPIVV